jgi:outer membrane immunogenic protein
MRGLRRLASCTAGVVAVLGLMATGKDVLAQTNNNTSSYNWSGYYGGANLGGSWGGSDVLSIIPSGLPFFEGMAYPGFPDPATPGIIAAYRSNSVGVKGFTGGFQGGYNFRTGGLVIGFEVDANLLNLKGSKTTTAAGFNFPVPGTTVYTFRSEIDADYLITARPRVGMLVGSGLLYATGGVALTTLNYSHAFRANGGGFNGIFENASFSETKIGWTAGGGYELPIGPNVSLKTEYLFTAFSSGSTNDNKIFPLGFSPPAVPAVPEVACGADSGQGLAFFGNAAAPTPRQCFNHKADLFLHTIRMGLNFKF